MSITIGHVLVIDDKYEILTRLWCLYDIFLAINKRRKNDYKIDFYKVAVIKVVGITDGLISTDSDNSTTTTEAHFTNKYKRELNFPFSFFQSVLQVNVKKAQTKDRMDEDFVRNAISNIEPSEVEFDSIVAGFFIASSLHRLIKEDEQLEEYFEVLKKSLSTDIRLDLVDCNNFNKQLATNLYNSLPLSLQTFYIKMKDTNTDVDNKCELKEYISKFKNIKELSIDGAKISKESLEHIFSCCKESSKMKLEKLCLINCNLNNENLKKLFEALNGNKILTELNLSKNKFNITTDAKHIFDTLKKTEIKKMDLTENVVEFEHILLNFNKRFRTMHISADKYQTPNVRQLSYCILIFCY